MRTVDADELIGMLSMMNTGESAQAPLEDVIAMIEAQQDAWIPVEKALPEDESMKLVSCVSKKGVKSINRAYYDGDGFWHGSGSMSGVKAWMDLPAPYEGTP